MERLNVEGNLTDAQKPMKVLTFNEPTPVWRGRPHSVHDVLNGAVGDGVIQNRPWLRVTRATEARAPKP